MDSQPELGEHSENAQKYKGHSAYIEKLTELAEKNTAERIAGGKTYTNKLPGG